MKAPLRRNKHRTPLETASALFATITFSIVQVSSGGGGRGRGQDSNIWQVGVARTAKVCREERRGKEREKKKLQITRGHQFTCSRVKWFRSGIILLLAPAQVLSQAGRAWEATCDETRRGEARRTCFCFPPALFRN